MVSVPNPCVYQTLQSVIGKHVVIETVRGKLNDLDYAKTMITLHLI